MRAARNVHHCSTTGMFCTISICGLDSVIPAARNCYSRQLPLAQGVKFDV
ncbi:hypothetical protein BLA9940_05220 [Burkholderia aenigmatica]|uniref:Uncharacterized protein n=1 Tax=Burkholderia aenigmatica TaxID=2015348 RepID=A0A6J5JHS5_9BURK|nr:hypothetical protein BLA3211_06431 [Burkholderia aenigmatica]VWC87314.1 hypothetical protein BLA9940_05220 [Burkholderia aenigmatica]